MSIFYLCLSLASFTASSSDTLSFVVVMHHSNSNLHLTRQQLKQMYLGSPLTHTNEQTIKPLTLPAGHPLRSEFNSFIIRLPESRIQGHWAQMRFTGQNGLPEQVNNINKIIALLIANPNTIGYIPKKLSNHPELTIVYR